MTAIGVIRGCLGMLDRRDQWKLVLVTLVQMATGFLDLAGVLLLGVVSVISVSIVSDTALPPQVQSIIDRLGLEDMSDTTLAAYLCIAAGVALVSKSLLSAVLTRRTYRFLAHRQAALSGRLASALLSRPLLDVQAKSSQDLAFVLTIATQTAIVGVLGAASGAVADVALLVVLGIGLTVIDPTVTFFAVVFFGLLAYGLQRGLSGWASRLGRESADVDIDSYMVIQEAVASYREITVLDRRGLYADRIRGLRWRSANIGADTQFMGIVPKFVFEIALVVGALALAISQAATKDVAAAVGIVAVFLVAGSRVMPAVMRLQGAALGIRRAEAPATKAITLAHDLSVTDGPPLSLPDVAEIRRVLQEGHPDFRPTVTLTDVWLTYPGTESAAVAGVSLTALEGTSIALVGSTGAGKSSLADILLGVVVPDVGTALIGGIPPTQAFARWPGGIAYVPQEVALINGTVRDNVTLGLPREAIDDDGVWRALERAHLAAFLRDGREGLETQVGESGMRLSGGQRQRLGVARALFTRPRLLVLDEATSALDSETEQAIADTMRDLEGEVTTVTIAHRLATVRHCDLVLYLENGRVVARGTFDEVRAQSATFDYQAQLLGL